MTSKLWYIPEYEGMPTFNREVMQGKSIIEILAQQKKDYPEMAEKIDDVLFDLLEGAYARQAD